MADKEDSMCIDDHRILGHCLSFGEAEDSFQRKKDLEATVKTPAPPKTPVKFSPWFRVERKASLVTFKTDRSQSHPLSELYNRHHPENYMNQVFKDVTQVGEGHFGKVYKVVSREDNKVYAVKVSKEIFHNESERSKRFEEVRKHEMIPIHPNCVRLFNAWEEQARLYLWLEFCDTSLENYAAKNHEISECKVWEILLDLLLGLKNLHDNHLVHVDVKLENILMTAEGVCKLADFGLLVDMSHIRQGAVPPRNSVEGDGRYLAPELLVGGPFSTAVDVFSLGICILELAADIVIPQGGDDWQMLRRGEIPAQKTTHLSDELKAVITQMLTPDHLQRPSVDKLLCQPRLQRMWCDRRQQQLSIGFNGAEAQLFPFSWLMTALNLLILLLSVPLKMAHNVKKKYGRPQRITRSRVNTALYGNKPTVRRRMGNVISPTSIAPPSKLWNMHVSDDELEVATILGEGQLDALASSTPFKPPTPSRNRGLCSIPNSLRTLSFRMNASESSNSPPSSPPMSPTSSFCARKAFRSKLAYLNSGDENYITSPTSLGESPCASPDLSSQQDTSDVISRTRGTPPAPPDLDKSLNRQNRTLPVMGRNLLHSFNSSAEDSDEEEKVDKNRDVVIKTRERRKR